MTVAAVVLAAGASSRLGEPKALALIDGRTALEHVLDGAAALESAHRPIVVTGAHHGAIGAFVRARGLDVDVVWNRDWERGRTGSVAIAATVRAGLDLLVAPVDVPLVSPVVFVAIRDAWSAAARPAAGWLAPWIRGPGTPPDGASKDDRRFGHPILLGRAIARQACSVAPDSPLRQLRASASTVLSVEVEDASILDDLDSREDLARLRRRVTGA